MTDAATISVPFRRVAVLVSQAEAAGLEVSSLSEELGIAPLDGPAAGKPISLGDYYRLQNLLAHRLGDETLRLSARNLVHGSTDFVLQHTLQCSTLVEAMETIARSYNMLHGGDFNRVVRKRSSIDYVVDDRNFPYTLDQDDDFILFSIECVLIFLHCMLTCVSPLMSDAVMELQVRRRSPGGDCGHLGYWNAPIKFGAEVYRVSFRGAVARAPIRPAPEALTSVAVYKRIVSSVAGKEPRAASLAPVSSLVGAALTAGLVDQKSVAERLGYSVATLRRRLAQEGVAFRELKQRHLNDRARRLLQRSASISEVAETLGFSDFRAFNRAFKQWNGVTPREFRSRSVDE